MSNSADLYGDSDTPLFKYAGFSGPHPTLAVSCPTCGAPEQHYCVEDEVRDLPRGMPRDRPHLARRDKAIRREVVQDIVDYFRSRPMGEPLDGSRPELPIRADEWAANVVENVWIKGMAR